MIKQNESEVGSDMLLVSRLFLHFNQMPIEFETRYFLGDYIARLINLCNIIHTLATNTWIHLHNI